MCIRGKKTIQSLFDPIKNIAVLCLVIICHSCRLLQSMNNPGQVDMQFQRKTLCMFTICGKQSFGVSPSESKRMFFLNYSFI